MTLRAWTVDPAAAVVGPGTWLLRAEASIVRPLAEVFDFFAAAENLERITPPSLRFRIVTPTPIEMRPGALIDYSLRLHGIPFGWRTEITEWNPPGNGTASFTDTQLRGPYHTWIHRHLFEAVPDAAGDPHGATEMVDEVRYRLPAWPVGGIALPIVRRQLATIFSHRMATLDRLLQ